MDPIDLGGLLAPRSIAVVGASPRPSPGRQLLAQLLAVGFPGTLHAVNPNHDEVLGVPCVATLDDLPGPVDLVAVLTPPDAVPAILDRADAIGAAGALVVSGPSSDGDLQRFHGRLPVLGPAAFGFVNVRARTAPLAAGNMHVQEMLRAGGCALVCQSGGLLLATLYYAHTRGLGFDCLVATGMEEGLATADLLDHFADDPSVTSIGVILESPRDGRRFEDAVARVRGRGKPVVVLPLGRSKLGRQGVVSHTGRMMGSHGALDALLRSYAVPSVTSVGELVETLLLHETGRPASQPGGPALIMVSGGTVALAADLAADAGLDLPPLAPATCAALAELIPLPSALSNPLDVNLQALFDQTTLRQVLDLLARDPAVNQVVAVLHIDPLGGSPNLAATIATLQEYGTSGPVPVALVSTTTDGITTAFTPAVTRLRIPFLQDVETGLRALSNVALADARPSSIASTPDEALEAASRLAAQAIEQAVDDASRRGDIFVGEVQAKRALAAAGFDVVAEKAVDDEDAVADAMASLTLPLVAKVVSPDAAHRARLGLVRTQIASPAAASEAYRRLDARSAELGVRVDTIVLQEQLRADLEVVVGITTDETFGRCVVLGMGGVLAELLGPPVVTIASSPRAAGRQAAAAAFGDVLRHAGLTEYQDALGQMAEQALALARALPANVGNIDLNPVVLTNGRCVLVDALIEMA